MVTKRSVLVVSVVCALLAPLCARDRKPGSSRIREVELPADYNIDLELALKGRPERMGGSPELVGTSLNQVGDEVFGNLVGNVAITSLRLPYRWKLTLVDADVVNASSTAGGQVYVYRNLATLIGSNRGLWAAVLSHEIAHTALRQQVRIYLQQRHYVAQEMQLLVREQEQQADIQGMFLMALAGYHPDYVFALHHLLQMTVGDESNSAAFFSDHPRWATRDQRGERAYAQALAEYSQLWAEPASSPGGTAPVVAFLSAPRVSQNKRTDAAEIDIPLYCRNSSQPVALMVHFTHGNAEVPAAEGPLRNSRGNLEVRESVPCTDREDAAPTEVHIPATALSESNRKLKAQVEVLGPTGTLIERSKAFDVSIPRPSRARAASARTYPSQAVASTPTADVNQAGSADGVRTFDGKASTPVGSADNDTPEPSRARAVAVRTYPAQAVAPTPTAENSQAISPDTTGTVARKVSTGVVETANNNTLVLLGIAGDETDAGFRVTAVWPGSLTGQVDLKPGDVVSKINNKRVYNGRDIESAIAANPGATIILDYQIRGIWLIEKEIRVR